MAEVAKTPAPAVPAPAPVAPAGGKKFPILLVVLIGAGVLCVIAAAVVYFLFVSGADKKFETAKENVATLYEDYIDDAMTAEDEEEAMDDYITMISEAQKETAFLMCFGISDESDKEDCNDLKTAITESKRLAQEMKAIYDADEEEEKEDELEEMEEDFTDYNTDVITICDVNWF